VPLDYQYAFGDDLSDFERAFAWWRRRRAAELRGRSFTEDPPQFVFRGDAFPTLAKLKSGEARPLTWPDDLKKSDPLIVIAAGGGIDSTGAALAARERWGAEAMMLLVRSDTGQEPEDSHDVVWATAQHIRAPLVTLLPPEDLYTLSKRHGRIPNTLQFGGRKSIWCTEGLKGKWLDRFGGWLAMGRKSRTTKHVSGLLVTEPSRVESHQKFQTIRFGDWMLEIPLLAEESIDKRRAFEMTMAAGLPISSTYELRWRHGCVPCKHWVAAQWRDFYRSDPAGFEAAAEVEDFAAVYGKTSKRKPKSGECPVCKQPKGLDEGRVVEHQVQAKIQRRKKGDKRKYQLTSCPGAGQLYVEKGKKVGTVSGKPMRIWLLGGPRKRFPKGATLREWLVYWDEVMPGWRDAPTEFPGLLDDGGRGLDAVSYEEGGTKALVQIGKKTGRNNRRRRGRTTELGADLIRTLDLGWDRGGDLGLGDEPMYVLANGTVYRFYFDSWIDDCVISCRPSRRHRAARSGGKAWQDKMRKRFGSPITTGYTDPAVAGVYGVSWALIPYPDSTWGEVEAAVASGDVDEGHLVVWEGRGRGSRQRGRAALLGPDDETRKRVRNAFVERLVVLRQRGVLVGDKDKMVPFRTSGAGYNGAFFGWETPSGRRNNETIRIDLSAPDNKVRFKGSYEPNSAPVAIHLVAEVSDFLDVYFADNLPRAACRWYDREFAETIAHELAHAATYRLAQGLGKAHAPGLIENRYSAASRPVYYDTWDEYHAFLFEYSVKLDKLLAHYDLRGDDVRDAFRYFVGAPGYGPLGRTWDQAGWMGAFAPEMGGFWWHLRSKNPRRWRRAVRRLWTAVAQPYADRDGGR
jgi:hypothetical protein